jgi:outer membrane protein OmpA-like peptidoglycan-associated protein
LADGRSKPPSSAKVKPDPPPAGSLNLKGALGVQVTAVPDMPGRWRWTMMMSRALVAAGLAAGLAIFLAGRPGLAEDLSAQQIQQRLTAPKTRSLTATDRPQLSSDDLAFVKRVRGLSRSLSLDDREQMAAIATKRPKVDLEINFDYNSADVTPKAEPQLNSLGKALTAKDLAGSVIMLGGHTDAKGSDDYNQRLSERRAETVKRFLIDNYKIPAANLVTAGYGKKDPKNPSDLFAAENRRVEIVNMAEREEALK